MLLVLTVGTITGALAFPNLDKEGLTTPRNEVIKVGCANGIFSPICLKRGAISLFKKLNAKEKVALFPGISLVKDSNVSEQSEVLAKSVDSDENLDKVLLYQMGTFMDTHSLKLKFPRDESEKDNALSEARKQRGKKGGGLATIIALAAMMKGCEGGGGTSPGELYKFYHLP